MVGTEMLYFLVGSRELDGGAMVTASHNPKAYTGVKLVREGALALSGDAGIGDVQAMIADGLGEAPGRRQAGGRRHLRGLRPPRALGHRHIGGEAAEGHRRRRQRDGGADGRPAARPPRPRSRRDLLGPRRRVPGPRAEPAAAREPPVHHRPGARRGRRPRDRLGRGRRPLLLHRLDRRVRRRRLPHRAARRGGCSPSSPAQGSSTTSAPAAPFPTRSRPPAAPRT